MDFCCFYFPLFCIHWLMGDHLLPANPAGDADSVWTDTVGFQSAAQVGRRMGEMADKVSYRTFLRRHALLRGIILLYNSLIISVVILQNTST